MRPFFPLMFILYRCRWKSVETFQPAFYSMFVLLWFFSKHVECSMTDLPEFIFALTGMNGEWMNPFEGTAFNLIPFGKKSYVNLINTQSTWRSFVSWAAGLHVDLSGPDPPCLSSPIFECISIRATEEKEPPVLQNFRAPFQLFSGPNGAKTSLRVGELWIDSMRSMHSNTHKAIQLQNALSGRTCLFWTPV